MLVARELDDGVEMWSGLRVMENTPALKYQWQQSHCNDLLLQAVNIDARNIVSRVASSCGQIASELASDSVLHNVQCD